MANKFTLKEIKKEIDSLKSASENIETMLINGYFNNRSDNKDVLQETIVVSGNTKKHDSVFGYETQIDLLLDTSDQCLKVLNAISTPERYLILKSLIERAKTANEIREEMKYKTKGRAYHHLNYLLAASVISKEGDYFKIESSKIGSILTIALGIEMLARKI